MSSFLLGLEGRDWEAALRRKGPPGTARRSSSLPVLQPARGASASPLKPHSRSGTYAGRGQSRVGLRYPAVAPLPPPSPPAAKPCDRCGDLKAKLSRLLTEHKTQLQHQDCLRAAQRALKGSPAEKLPGELPEDTPLEVLQDLAERQRQRLTNVGDQLQLIVQKKGATRAEAAALAALHDALAASGVADLNLMELTVREAHTHARIESLQQQNATLMEDVAQLRTKVQQLYAECAEMEQSGRRQHVMLAEGVARNEKLKRELQTLHQNIRQLDDNDEEDQPQKLQQVRQALFNLVRHNSATTSCIKVLRRQKRWFEAMANVLKEELRQVYLGGSQVRSTAELGVMADEECAKQSNAGEWLSTYEIISHPNKREGHQVEWLDFLSTLSYARGRNVKSLIAESDGIWNEEIRQACITMLGRESYLQECRSQQLSKLMLEISEMVTFTTPDAAVSRFTSSICKLLECERAAVWFLDRKRQVLWTRVRPSCEGSSTVILTAAVPKADSEINSLLFAAYCSKESIFTAAAQEDSRFDRTMDGATGFTTKNMLTVPVVNKRNRVVAVVQVANHLKSQTFKYDDAFLCSLIGSLAVEVIAVCDSNAFSLQISKRKRLVMLVAEEMMGFVRNPKDLLRVVQTVMMYLFNAEQTALHIVAGSQTSQLIYSGISKQVEKVPNTAKVSLVDHCVSMRSSLSVHFQKAPGGSPRKPNQYAANVDLPIPSEHNTFLHTFPIMNASAVSGVLQFTTLDLEEAAFRDDGSFHHLNRQHTKVLTQFLNYINHLLARFYDSEKPETGSKQDMPSIDPFRMAHVVLRARRLSVQPGKRRGGKVSMLDALGPSLAALNKN
mmetsp:Transcript_15828/g.35200  ORF Transcript_15828/g.35200 Transcript_15828/m.35200 type:complete len:841 (-) Transcript_15828:73-2595(-)